MTLGGLDGEEEEDTGMRWSRKWWSGRRMGHPCGHCSSRTGEGLGWRERWVPGVHVLDEWLVIVGDTVRGLLEVGKY